ncbi:MAG: hypothetical protein ACTSRG_10245 [Candidatus Helarchaeota archaeon]
MAATQIGDTFVLPFIVVIIAISCSSWMAIYFAKKLYSLVKYNKLWESWNKILWSWVFMLFGGIGLAFSLLILYLLNLVGQPLSFIQVFFVLFPLFIGLVLGTLVVDIGMKKFYDDVSRAIKETLTTSEDEV